MMPLTLKSILAFALAAPLALQAAPECVTVRPGKTGLIEFGQIASGSTKTVTVTVSNRCQNPSSNISLNVSGIGFESTMDGKSIVIPARTRTKFTVKFAPTEEKTYSGLLSVYHSKELGSTLSGSGIGSLPVDPVIPTPVDPIDPVDTLVIEEEIPADEQILDEVPIEDLISEEGPTGINCCKKIRSQMLVRKASGVSYDVTGRQLR